MKKLGIIICGLVSLAQSELVQAKEAAVSQSQHKGQIKAQPQTQKLYTVNLAEVLEKFYKAKESREGFDILVKNAEKETETMIQEGKPIIEKIQDLQKKVSNPALEQTAKDKLTTEIEEQYALLQKKEKEINEFREQTDSKLSQKKQALISEHFKEINQQVTEIAKQKGADLVFNSAGVGVVYAKPEYDLTEEVIRAVNKGNPQSATVNKETKQPAKAQKK